MKTNYLVECPLVPELVEKFLEKFKAEDGNFDADAVDGKTETEMNCTALEDLNNMINECLNLGVTEDEIEEGEDGQDIKDLIVELITSFLQMLTIKSIKIAPDCINLVIEIEE